MKRADAHDEVQELVPWYVNGTLSDAEHARVERHVHECLTCYAVLQQERRMRALIRSRSTARLSAEQGFDRLMARIEREAPRPARRVPRRRARRLARYGALAAAAGIVALAAAALVRLGTVPMPGTAPAGYETLTGAPERGGATLDIIFAQTLSEPEMRAVLREIDATIVAGPTDIGRYTVRLDAPEPTADELSAILERLRRDDRVRFAGRSYIEAQEGP